MTPTGRNKMSEPEYQNIKPTPADRKRKQKEITKHKKLARSAYYRMRREAPDNGADCGHELMSHINPRYSAASYDYDQAMEWLKENDPDFPATSTKINNEAGQEQLT